MNTETYFDHRNCDSRTMVFDVEALHEIKMVESVDTDSGELVRYAEPLRVNHLTDEAERVVERYRSIYPIYGGSQRPVLFHCYGKQA